MHLGTADPLKQGATPTIYSAPEMANAAVAGSGDRPQAGFRSTGLRWRLQHFFPASRLLLPHLSLAGFSEGGLRLFIVDGEGWRRV